MSQSRNIIEMIRHRGNQQVSQIAPVKGDVWGTSCAAKSASAIAGKAHPPRRG
jgi:hypothetical protein